jgi:hemerythrin-like metal-binding protein
VKTLDEQHMAFIGIINELHGAMMKGRAAEVALPLLDKVMQYGHKHFADEEALMQSTGFPSLAQHRAQHQDLERKAAAYAQKAKNGDSTVFLPLLHFLRDWLNNHLVQEDQKYTEWMHEHGIR